MFRFFIAWDFEMNRRNKIAFVVIVFIRYKVNERKDYTLQRNCAMKSGEEKD